MTPTDLQHRRAALRLSQAALGRALGVHGNTIAKWERGDQPIRHPVILRLALDRLAELDPPQTTTPGQD